MIAAMVILAAGIQIGATDCTAILVSANAKGGSAWHLEDETTTSLASELGC